MDGSQVIPDLLLVDYARLSELLNDGSFWKTPGPLYSILLIAKNGSVLAHAYAKTPTTRVIRSEATSYSATFSAYADSKSADLTEGITCCTPGQATVITSITKHVFLAVTGRTSEPPDSEANPSSASSTSDLETKADEPGLPQDELDDLLSISDELTSLLRVELSTMLWPEDF